MTHELLDIKGPDDFQIAFNVSHETIERFRIYADTLSLWQKSKNLVAPSTVKMLWQRHLADSAQIVSLAKGANTWYDFGSGAGFPGLVVALLLADSQFISHYQEKPCVSLFESNGKKCAFLHDIVRKTAVSEFVTVEIHDRRIETLSESAHSVKPDVVTARALAPLVDLIELSLPILGKSSCCLFQKGRDVQKEIELAEKKWRFSYELVASRTDPEGCIVRLDGVQPV